MPYPRLTVVTLAAAMMFAVGSPVHTLAVKAPVLTPPMGWNSYDCYSYGVTEAQFMANVHYMADSLKQYGWQYCIVDYVWWVPDKGAGYAPAQSSNWTYGNIDQYGRLMPDTTRFPSAKGGVGFRALADSVHNLGLKFGIHIMRGVPRMAARKGSPIYNSTYTCKQAADTTSTCSWCDWMWGTKMTDSAGQAYMNSILTLYNSWNIDFIKIDDLSAATYRASEVVGYAKAIASVSREIVFSTSPGPTPTSQASHVMQYANQWRLVNDLWDTWSQLTNSFSVSETWRKLKVNGAQISGPGHWLDVDMLPFGHLAIYGPVGSPRYSLASYTQGEHRLMYFLWCINNGPLFWGGSLPDNKTNPFYDSLTMNRDAIFINQHGTKGRVLTGMASANLPVWISTHPTDTSTKFVALFNLSGSTATITVRLDSLGIIGTAPVKDVWTGKSLGNFTTTFSRSIASHDAGLYIVGTGTATGTIHEAPVSKTVGVPDGKMSFYTIGSRFDIPASFAGKTVRVSVYNLNGRQLNSVITSNRSINLTSDKKSGKQVRIVKITALQ